MGRPPRLQAPRRSVVARVLLILLASAKGEQPPVGLAQLHLPDGAGIVVIHGVRPVLELWQQLRSDLSCWHDEIDRGPAHLTEADGVVLAEEVARLGTLVLGDHKEACATIPRAYLVSIPSRAGSGAEAGRLYRCLLNDRGARSRRL